MHNSSLVAIAQYFWRIRTSVLYGNQKKFNTEAVDDYPPIRFEIRFERKFPIVSLYFLTLPVETLWNLCPVEKLFGMRMAGLCQFYWHTCYFYFHILIFCLFRVVDQTGYRSAFYCTFKGKGLDTCYSATYVSQTDSWPATLYNLGSGSWLAWTNDAAAHYVAIHCPR